MPDQKPTKRPSSRGVRRRAPAPGSRSPVLATDGGAVVASRGKVGRPVEDAAYQLPKVPPVPAGWRVIAGREFTEHLLSVRFLVMIGLVGLVGVFLIYTLSNTIRQFAGTLTTNLTYYTGEPFPLFLFMFSAPPDTGGNTTLSAVGSFASIVTQYLGPLLGLAFGFDAISNERSEGTLPRLVAQPIHRDDVINGKFVASLSIVALIMGAVMLVLAGVGIYQLGVIPTGDVAVRLVVWWAFLVLYVAFWLALATLFSVLFRRAATALLAVLAVWLVVTFFGGQIAGIIANTISPSTDVVQTQVDNVNVQLALLRLFPSGQFTEMTAVMLNPSLNSLNASITDPTGAAIPTLLPVSQSLLLVWPQVVTMIGLTSGCFALAYVTFMRQEVRA